MDEVTILHCMIGLIMLVFGIHQFWQPQEWYVYLPKFVLMLLPISKETLMKSHAIGNIVLGSWLIVFFAPHVVTLLAILWWVSIVPMAFKHRWDIGMRDLVIFSSLLALYAAI